MPESLVNSSDPFPLSARVRVRTYELDSFGHVNNAVYLQYIEEARSEYLKQMGLSFNDLATFAVQIVIAESHIRYLAPLRYGDTVQIQGRIREARVASLLFDYRLLREETGDLVAEAWTRGVFVRAATGKPTRAPQMFLDAFSRFSNDRNGSRDAV